MLYKKHLIIQVLLIYGYVAYWKYVQAYFVYVLYFSPCMKRHRMDLLSILWCQEVFNINIIVVLQSLPSQPGFVFSLASQPVLPGNSLFMSFSFTSPHLFPLLFLSRELLNTVTRIIRRIVVVWG